MSTVVTRPNATVANGDGTPSAGTRHGCLSDNSDSTYVTVDGTTPMKIGFAEPVIPAGARVKAVQLRARSGTPDAITVQPMVLSIVPPTDETAMNCGWVLPTTHVVKTIAHTDTPVGCEIHAKSGPE